MRIADLLVVGAGPAGVAAAVQAARLGLDARIVDRTGAAGGLVANGFLVENYPGLEAPIAGAALAARIADHLARFGLGVERAEVRDLRCVDDVWIAVADAGELPARAIALALGTRPKRLGAAGEDGCAGRVFHEVRGLLAAIPSPARVAIAGGGEASLDYALTLAAAGARVLLLVRGEALKARGRLVRMAAREEAIEILPSTRIDGIAPAEGGLVVDAVRGGAPETLHCDALLVAIGREPALSPIFPDCGHGRPRGRELEISPGLFLCGDARLGGLGQVGIAVGDGLEVATILASRAGR